MRGTFLAFLLLAACTRTVPTTSADGAARPAAVPEKPKERLRVELDIVRGPLLFAEEHRQLEDRIGAWLAERGHDVVPRAELDRVEATALAGKRPGSDAVCGAPVSPAVLARHIFRDVPTAEGVVTCSSAEGARERSGCTLSVRTNREQLEAAVAGRADLASLLAAVPSLAAVPKPPPGGQLASLGSESGKQRRDPLRGMSIGSIRVDGPWTAAVAEQPLEKRLAACHDDRDSWYVDAVRVEVDARGRVARCEPDPGSAPPVNFACYCAALSAHDFGAGAAGRRGRLDFYQWGEPVRDAAGRWLTVRHGKDPRRASAPTDPSVLAAGFGLSGSALAACFAGQRVPDAGDRLDLDWEISATGGVDAVRFDAKGWPDSVADCLGKVLETATFACPQGGVPARARSFLSVVLHDRGAP